MKVTCVRKYRHTLYIMFKRTQTSVSEAVFTFVAVFVVTVRVRTGESGLVTINIVQ